MKKLLNAADALLCAAGAVMLFFPGTLWLGMAVCFAGLLYPAVLLLRALIRRYPVPGKVLAALSAAVLLAGSVWFGVCEAQILAQAGTDETPAPAYIVVLGAQVNGTVPSSALRVRIDRAAEYLREHPDTKAVVSGGMGSGEDITEAQCMYDALRRAGIAPGRILQESRAVNTRENLSFSAQVIAEDCGTYPGEIGIVTETYHLCRAKALCRKLGITPAGIAAKPAYPLIALSYYLRETAAMTRFDLCGY